MMTSANVAKSVCLFSEGRLWAVNVRSLAKCGSSNVYLVLNYVVEIVM